MLVGFYKKPQNCDCFIIKYVDRIWLKENGDADILRVFVVEVGEREDNVSLEELRVLLPYKNIQGVEVINHTCFLPSSDYLFNSPEFCTTQTYTITQPLSSPIRFDSFGIINDDGIENIKVFPKIDNAFYDVGSCSVVRFRLPVALQAGERMEIRLKFKVASLFDKVTTGISPTYFVEFPYFSSLYKDEIAQLDGDLEVKVKPTLGTSESKFIGGFDIFLYFPVGFEKVSGFHPFKEKYDSLEINGRKTENKRIKMLWRLRELLKSKGLPENHLTCVGENLLLTGTLQRSYSSQEAMELLSKQIPRGFTLIGRKISRSNWVSYLALGLSILAFLISILRG